MRERAETYFRQLQERICSTLEQLDGKATFCRDEWTRDKSDGGGGGGLTRVLHEGAVFEQAGVNFSAVSGQLSDTILQRIGGGDSAFFATGISLVIHPKNPMVPTTHMNCRYIEKSDAAWFGGGLDLTPYYLYDEDAAHFHQVCKKACDAHEPEHYPRFKKWCDDYFFLTHRNEARGIGGLFFDYLKDDLEKTFAFVQATGDCFLDAYVPIVTKRMDETYNEAQRAYQLYRRGRYVEFNLVYDRGTLFGLETKGRVESILMSLPPVVHWSYNWSPEPGSREARLYDVLTHPRDWVVPDGATGE